MEPSAIAQWVLEQSLKGAPWSKEDVDQIIDDRSLFRILAEGLSDRFEPALAERYAEIFSYVLARKTGEGTAEALLERFGRVRVPRVYAGGDVAEIYVLSRVTLGADVAITSVMLDGLKRRFRQARIWLCGDRKSYQLFEADARIGYYPLFYERGASLDGVLANRPFFKTGLVVDPDSRISQLGLLPLCPEANYYLFESRSAGGGGNATVTELAADWMRTTFGVEAKAYVAPRPVKASAKSIAVSLGTGGNPAKRVDNGFERMLMEKLAALGAPVVVDLGAGGDESERVRHATMGLPGVTLHKGSFADFASVIAQSARYYGYDSSGTHVAAVSGVPLTVFFKGHVSDRMFERWKPAGRAAMKVVRVDEEHPDAAKVLAAAF